MTQPIAIAHDYLTQRGGAERVVEAMAKAYPDAPIYTTFYDAPGTYPFFANREVTPALAHTSWSRLARNHRLALPVLPRVVDRIMIDAEVTICSSSGWAHGVKVTGKKLVYCYSPARWLYESTSYLGAGLSFRAAGLHLVRRRLVAWDQAKARTADSYLAISTVVRDRIRNTYGIDARVVPAPMTFDASGPQESLADCEPGFILCVSRLLKYKNVSEVVTGCSKAGVPLIIVGQGPEERELRKLAGANVRFFKGISEAELRFLYANCRFLVSSSHEDFGLTPLEAAALGKPSLVLRGGGFLDTILEGETGLFFPHAIASEIVHGIREMSTMTWDEGVLRKHAASFSSAAFAGHLRGAVSEL